jgi:hypothetical protein
VTVTLSQHLVYDLYNLMAASCNNSSAPQPPIHFNRELSTPALVSRGQHHSYFEDSTTIDLLGVDAETSPLLATGTYGDVELGITAPTLQRLCGVD